MAKMRGVRGAASACALGAMLYLLADYALQLFVSYLMGLRVAGASLTTPVGFTAATVALLRLLTAAGAILVPLVWLLRATRLRARDLRVLWPSRWSPLFCLGLFLGLANLANLLGGLLAWLLGRPGVAVILPSGGWALAVDFVLLCLLPAVGEEVLFRGALQGLMRPCGSAAAIAAPALLFALLHLDLAQDLTALACGLFLGWLAERTGSILPGMLLHLVNNCLAFLNLYLHQFAPPQAALYVQLSILLVLPLLAGLLLWRALRQGFQFSAGLRPGPAATAIFSSPVYSLTVVFLILYSIFLGVAR